MEACKAVPEIQQNASCGGEGRSPGEADVPEKQREEEIKCTESLQRALPWVFMSKGERNLSSNAHH